MVFCLVELRGLEPLTPCLQNTPGLSGTVAHLALGRRVIRWDRSALGAVVVRPGGQRSLRLGSGHLIGRDLHEHPKASSSRLVS
jgi:hypothetical protein